MAKYFRFIVWSSAIIQTIVGAICLLVASFSSLGTTAEKFLNVVLFFGGIVFLLLGVSLIVFVFKGFQVEKKFNKQSS